MDNDNLIKVPAEYASILGRMGLPEYKIVQEDADGIVISAPIELCRTLLRMGLVDYKDATDSNYLIVKATKCEFVDIAEAVMGNIAAVTKLTQSGNDVAVNVEFDELVDITSPVTGQTKKYIVLLVKTNFDTIVGAKFNNVALTETDVENAAKLGGAAGTIAWWVDAAAIKGAKLTATVEKENYTTETISVTGTDVSKYNLTYTNEEGNVTAVFTGANGRTITPGEDVINLGETVNMTLTATNSKFIDTVTVNGEEVNVGATSFTAQIIENANTNVTVVVTEVAGVTLSYNANDAEATGTTASQTVATGYKATVVANGFEVTGKVFSKWNTASDGTGTDYDPEVEITMTANLELFAIWTAEL